MKKWLLCLFTYNRYELLRNAVRSIELFFPYGDRLVIDDGSSDQRVRQFLERDLPSQRWKYTIRERIPGRDYGGFYNNMRYGLEYALEHGYDYCFFCEDDQQMVWKKDDYEEYVNNVFSTCPDAIQVQPLLARRILSYSTTMEYIKPAHAYRTDRGFNTTAIWNLDVVRRHSDYRFICEFGSDLPANSAYWMRKGFRLYVQFDPTIAIVPWVNSQSVFHHPDTIVTNNFGKELLLKPLTPDEIAFLKSRPPSLPAYQEYFNLSEENVSRPIWHQQGQGLNRFFFLCRDIVEKEDKKGESPMRIPVLDDWAPTTIPPVQSHLNWKPLAGSARRTSRMSPRWSKRFERFVELLRFSPRDYLGYLRLRKRLHKEQKQLPFEKQEPSPYARTAL